MSCIVSVDGIILWLLILLVNYVIQLTLTLKMTTAQVVETSVSVNNNNPIQGYVHPDDQTQPTFEILVLLQSCLYCFYLDHNVFIFSQNLIKVFISKIQSKLS